MTYEFVKISLNIEHRSLQILQEILGKRKIFVHDYKMKFKFFVTFSRPQSRFSNFKNCFWRRKWRENSEKNARCPHADLSIESLHVAIGALIGLKSHFLWHFHVLRLRFSNFKNRLWRREWKKNSGKNTRCPSHLDISIELSKLNSVP